MPGLKPISQKQFLVVLDQLPQAYFTKATGIEESYETQKYNDGETGVIRTHVGFLDVGNVTLSKVYDPEQDASMLAWWDGQKKERSTFSVSIQAVTADTNGTVIPGSGTLLLQECQVVRFKYPEVDRESSSMAMLEIEIVPGTVTKQ